MVGDPGRGDAAEHGVRAWLCLPAQDGRLDGCGEGWEDRCRVAVFGDEGDSVVKE